MLNLHKEIKEDEYLVPYAIVEIAWLYIDEGRIENAIAALEDVKYVQQLKQNHHPSIFLFFSDHFKSSKRRLTIIIHFRKNYTGYSLESRLHFRIHNALSELKPKNRSRDKNNSSPDHEH